MKHDNASAPVAGGEGSAQDVTSAHGNGCECCCHRRFPDDGHCYMFREEPEVCFAHKYDREMVEQIIENVGKDLQ